MCYVLGCVSSPAQELQLDDGRRVPYDRLCVCTGARPKVRPNRTCDLVCGKGALKSLRALTFDSVTASRLAQVVLESLHVLTLRDVDSVDALAARLVGARRVVLVGNGGIALELACVHALLSAFSL